MSGWAWIRKEEDCVIGAWIRNDEEEENEQRKKTARIGIARQLVFRRRRLRSRFTSSGLQASASHTIERRKECDCVTDRVCCVVCVRVRLGNFNLGRILLILGLGYPVQVQQTPHQKWSFLNFLRAARGLNGLALTGSGLFRAGLKSHRKIRAVIIRAKPYVLFGLSGRSVLTALPMECWRWGKNDVKERGVEWVQHSWSRQQRDTWDVLVCENRRVYRVSLQADEREECWVDNGWHVADSDWLSGFFSS